MPYLAAPLYLAMALAPAPATAQPLQLEWNLRLRYEGVEDDAFVHDANADTVRLRAGLRAAFGSGWSALLEGEGIASAGDYNSGANGRVDWPVITDPRGSGLNQAWIGWRGAHAAGTVGRQRVTLDNQRFIGNSGWRQNEQTFDAVSLEASPKTGLELRYLWLDSVQRVSGDEALDPLARERDLATQLFNASFKRGSQQWVAYVYLNDDRDVAAASTATHGLRWTGNHTVTEMKWGWSAELARQTPYADNPSHFGHSYWLIEPTLKWGRVDWKLGWEHLGGDGRHALQTPLGSLHAFNGWADKFLVTPANGLDDAYLLASTKTGKATWTLVGHDFHADQGDQHYGREWDLSIAAPLNKCWNGMLKFADYRSDDFARDTAKFWIQLEYVGSQSL